MENIDFVNLIIIAIVSGLIGTTAMTIFLNVLTKSGKVNADMVRALGSLFTKSLDNAFKTGIVIHFISGILFSFLYTFLIFSFEVTGFINIIFSGVLISFIHGAVVGFLLVATVSEHHPLPEFQKTGFSVAIAHWVAHLIYGLFIGIMIGLF